MKIIKSSRSCKNPKVEASEETMLTICPSCGGNKFNDVTGLCLDCGYDEKSWGNGPYYDAEYEDDFDDYDHDYKPSESDWQELSQPVESASYGGAYDIQDDEYFTRDDIIQFGDVICDLLMDEYGKHFDIYDVRVDNNILSLELECDDYIIDSNVKIDMRRIRKPSDIMKYTNEMLNKFKQQLDAYVASSSESTITSYDHRDIVTYNNHKYAVRYTHVNTSPDSSADGMFDKFKFQISRIAPYDDADYAWCEGQQGIVKVYRGNKLISKTFYMNADDMDVENNEWCDTVIDQTLSMLEQYNHSIEPKITHSSTSGSEYQSLRRDFPHLRRFKDRNSGELMTFLEELDHKKISYAIYDDVRDNGCTVFYDESATPIVSATSLDIKSLQDKLYNAAYSYLHDKLDWSLRDIADMVIIDAGKVEDDRYRVEVRAELDYDWLYGLTEALNSVLWEYDHEAYFDMVEPGIAEAYISMNSIQSSTSGYVYTYCDSCGYKNRVLVEFPESNKPFLPTEYKCENCGATNKLVDNHKYSQSGDIINASTDDEIDWYKMDRKIVKDSDGFNTEYTWYANEDDTLHVFIFGDADIYDPYNTEPDFETDDYDAAKEWFDSYTGFEDDEDIYSSSRSSGWNILPPNFLESELGDKFKQQVVSYLEDTYLEPFHVDLLKVRGDYLIMSVSSDNYAGSASIKVDTDSYQEFDDILNYTDEMAKELEEDINWSVEDRSVVTSADNVSTESTEVESSGEINIKLDKVIVFVDEDGNWEYEDDSYPWANSNDSSNGDWYDDKYHIYLDDPSGVVEKFDELVEPNMPGYEGRYQISCEATLTYDLDNIVSKKDYFESEDGHIDYDETTITEDADAVYNKFNSVISNFTYSQIK